MNNILRNKNDEQEKREMTLLWKVMNDDGADESPQSCIWHCRHPMFQ